jgi:hypothetical protein
VNYAPNQSQCYVRLPFSELKDAKWQFLDLLGAARYDRDGNDLQAQGFYLDEPGWQYHVFEITRQ